MLGWIHRKTYKHAIASESLNNIGVNIIHLAENEIGPTQTQILVERAYKIYPNSPRLGSEHIYELLKEVHNVPVDVIIMREKMKRGIDF